MKGGGEMRFPFDEFNPKVPPPSLRGVVFNLLMLASPFIGLALFGPAGLIFGMIVAGIGLSWFFRHSIFRSPFRGNKCENCGRPFINLGRGSSFAERMNMPGTLFDVNEMRAGFEGPGDECLRCGRVYCSSCAMIDNVCKCGSKNFRTVRLRYRF